MGLNDRPSGEPRLNIAAPRVGRPATNVAPPQDIARDADNTAASAGLATKKK